MIHLKCRQNQQVCLSLLFYRLSFKKNQDPTVERRQYDASVATVPITMNAQQMVHALCNATIRIKQLGLSRHASIKDHIGTPYATVWREFRPMKTTPVAVKRIFAMANVKLLPQCAPLVREHHFYRSRWFGNLLQSSVLFKPKTVGVGNGA